jgi:Mn2+/Fe2+ NRAMP family transporter
MWSAAITSVVGAAYTSVSFLRSLSPGVDRRWRAWIIGFIVGSAGVFLLVGRPVKVLILVGALNALVLPIGLVTMLVASRRPAIVGGYRHPAALAGLGWVVAVAMTAMGGWTLWQELPRMFR